MQQYFPVVALAAENVDPVAAELLRFAGCVRAAQAPSAGCDDGIAARRDRLHIDAVLRQTIAVDAGEKSADGIAVCDRLAARWNDARGVGISTLELGEIACRECLVPVRSKVLDFA